MRTSRDLKWKAMFSLRSLDVLINLSLLSNTRDCRQEVISGLAWTTELGASSIRIPLLAKLQKTCGSRKLRLASVSITQYLGLERWAYISRVVDWFARFLSGGYSQMWRMASQQDARYPFSSLALSTYNTVEDIYGGYVTKRKRVFQNSNGILFYETRLLCHSDIGRRYGLTMGIALIGATVHSKEPKALRNRCRYQRVLHWAYGRTRQKRAGEDEVEEDEKAEDEEAEEKVRPAALLAPEEETWSVSSSTTSNLPFSFPSSGVSTSYARPVSTRPHLELVVKPHSKVILPCELEGNYSRLLLSGSRSYRIHGNPAVWLHEGNPVDMLTINTRTEMSGTGHRYIGDSTTAALHIDNVRLEDDGMWECTLEHDQEEFLLGRPIKLVVLDQWVNINTFYLHVNISGIKNRSDFVQRPFSRFLFFSSFAVIHPAAVTTATATAAVAVAVAATAAVDARELFSPSTYARNFSLTPLAKLNLPLLRS
uniref:Ig-like domain-containing protein n=1 Tax=Vespula pensylvanica TaxID=30213 RepID=A0A834PCA7_VESPE|nr:hypothetical protein H0235_003687 [Vespula pensylvanica]